MACRQHYATVEITAVCPTRRPTGVGETYAPSPAPTDPLTTEQGAILCGETKDGDTGNPGLNLEGCDAPEHVWSFEVTTPGWYRFDTCGSSFRHWMTVELPGVFATSASPSQNGGECGFRTDVDLELDVGLHRVVISGCFQEVVAGSYVLSILGDHGADCPAAPTPSPTPSPTTAPSPAPTLFGCPWGYTETSDRPTWPRTFTGTVSTAECAVQCEATPTCTGFRHDGVTCDVLAGSSRTGCGSWRCCTPTPCTGQVTP